MCVAGPPTTGRSRSRDESVPCGKGTRQPREAEPVACGVKTCDVDKSVLVWKSPGFAGLTVKTTMVSYPPEQSSESELGTVIIPSRRGVEGIVASEFREGVCCSVSPETSRREIRRAERWPHIARGRRGASGARTRSRPPGAGSGLCLVADK